MGGWGDGGRGSVTGCGGGDGSTIVGDIPHDVVEGCKNEGHAQDLHARQISEKFGAEVLQIMLDVTHTTHDSDGKKLSSEARELMYLEHVAVASDKVRWVSAVDKLHNARSILSDLARASKPSDVWGRFNVGQDATIHWCRRVYDRLVQVGFKGDILPELLDAVGCLDERL